MSMEASQQVKQGHIQSTTTFTTTYIEEVSDFPPKVSEKHLIVA